MFYFLFKLDEGERDEMTLYIKRKKERRERKIIKKKKNNKQEEEVVKILNKIISFFLFI
jgi:hypothetical protein